jgi:hypothetical protein
MIVQFMHRTGFTLLAALFLLHWHPNRVQAEAPATAPASLYDPDPNHLWNRLDTSIRIRTAPDGQQFGADSIDLLLWPDTKHLLEGESHSNAIAALDAFLQTHGEQLIGDPIKRAILMRDLWACFDWTASRANDHPEQRQALESRLARVIQRLKLTQQQIQALPDVYAAAIEAAHFPAAFDPANSTTPFLPRDLFDRAGPWISIAARDDSPVAPVHEKAACGRSIFEIYFRHPDGRQAGLDYLEKLSKTPPYISDPSMRLNPDAAQFPVGTQLALVRRAILIDDQQKLAPMRLIESIQLRVYRRINLDRKPLEDQAFFEFQLRRSELLAEPASALHAFKPGDSEVTTFGGEDLDLFEDARPHRGAPVYTHGVLGGGCFGCHSEPGVQSMHSFTRFYPFASPGIVAADPKVETVLTISAKPKRDDWKLLVEMMGRDASR